MARRKLKAQENVCEPMEKTPKKRGRKAAPKKTVEGYKLLKRDENALVKQYAQIEKTFGDITKAVNDFCYNSEDKKKTAVETNKTITTFIKDVRSFQKSVKNAKDSLKPIYA
jgi:hypothetical protein